MLGYTTDKISSKTYDEFCELASRMCSFMKAHTELFDPMSEIKITMNSAEILSSVAGYQDDKENEDKQ